VFTAARPGQLHVADFTYVPMVIGFGYTAFVIDAFAGMIVGWECSLSKYSVCGADHSPGRGPASSQGTPTVRHHDPPLRRRAAARESGSAKRCCSKR